MEVHPADLRALARVVMGDLAAVQAGLHGLRAKTEAVALNPADPGFGTAGTPAAAVATRQDRVLTGLGRSARELAAIAEELNSAAADAIAADRVGMRWVGDQAPVCRLPDSVRTGLDRWLTDRIGTGMTATADGVVRVAGLFVPSGNSPPSGDAGGTFSSRRVPIPAATTERPDPGSSVVMAGRVVTAALDATTDQAVLAHDEFGLIDHGQNRFTVVLPGVTDLSRPERGWNAAHRSPRDLDMAAVASSRSTNVDHNVYAESVADALVANGVPTGAEVLIVGHSFGADTALDLAADPTFARRYRVSHVVATGYFSQPQLTSINLETKVLVVQNRSDLVVDLGSTMPTVEAGVFACEPGGVLEAAQSAATGDAAIVRFDGGMNRLGHSVEVYRTVFTGAADLDPGDSAVVDDFLGTAGPWSTEPPPSMLAIDISLPDR